MTEPRLLDHAATLLATGRMRLEPTDLRRSIVTIAPRERPREDDARPAEAVKWPPDPIVPPEYILAAWLIGNEIERSRDALNAELDAWRFTDVSFARPRSQVAPEFVRAATETSAAVRAAADAMHGELGLTRFEKVGHPSESEEHAQSSPPVPSG
jgi:hypothetical protein